MFAGVGAEFLGEFLPEDRVGLRLGAQLLQQRQTVLPPGELAQTGKFGELRSAVIGKLFEQLVQAGEQGRSVLVVAREGPFGAEGEPMLRSIGLHLLEHDLSFGASVLKKRALQRMQSIEERRIGEVEIVEQMRLSFRHERHAARPAGAVVLEESLRHCFARVILIGVANDQRAAQIVAVKTLPDAEVVTRVNGTPRFNKTTAASQVTVNSRAIQPFCSAQWRSLWAGVPS